MDELNKLVNNLTVSYGSYNTCKNKKTVASLRKELQKLKAFATLERKDVLNSIKPITPIIIEYVVPTVQPSLKKVKKLKDEVVEVKDEVVEVKDEMKDEMKVEVVAPVEIIEPVEPPLKKLKKNKKVVEPVKQSLKVVFPVS